MRNVLILGASGSVARYAIDLFLKETDARLTLDARNARNSRGRNTERVRTAVRCGVT
jgi:hypothetical protein